MKITIPEGFNTAPLFPKSVFFSVHDSEKPGLEVHAQALLECGIERVYASGGTARYLIEHDIPVIDFNVQITGKPPIMSHRVATLGYESAGAILSRRNIPQHMEELSQYCRGVSIVPVTFDIVAVSIYPFEQIVCTEEVDLLTAVENIDIGGPTLLREAAKNFEWVVPIPGMKWMKALTSILNEGKGVPMSFRTMFAATTFRLISSYDAVISEFMKNTCDSFES